MVRYMQVKVKGDITANSLTLGTSAQEGINGMIDGATSGLSRDINSLSGNVNGLLNDLGEFSGKVASWGITDMGDYLRLDNTVACGDTSVLYRRFLQGFCISRQRLFQGRHCGKVT